MLFYFAGAADKISGDTVQIGPKSFNFTVREPIRSRLGPIVPWNATALDRDRSKLAPALAAGNTVVIKPSEHASATTLELAHLVAAAGFPPGVINVVSGGVEAGRALVPTPASVASASPAACPPARPSRPRRRARSYR